MYAHDSTDIVLPSESLRSEPSNQTPLLALVWLRGNRREQDARMVVEDMLRHACGPYGLTALTGGDAQLAWGVLLPDKFAPLTCWSIYVSGAELCLVEGDIYDDLPGLQILPGDNPGLGRRIAAHMREQPDRRLTDLIGIYSGIYVDRDRSSAYAFGDPTGTRPVFWLSDATRFVVMSDLWAYRGWSGFERHWDKMALVELLTIGLPMAGRTWLEGVKQLQRGRQIRTFADGRTEVRMLLEPIPRQSWSFRESVRALRESMDETIGRLCRRLDSPVGLALSGGLDSRLLLASLHTRRLDHLIFTFRQYPRDPDARIAGAASELLGERHRTLLLDSAVASVLNRDCRILNGGQSPASGYLLLATLAQQDCNALMLGYPGDVLAGAPLGPFRPLCLKSNRALANSLLQAYMSQFAPDQALELVAPPYRVSWQDVLDEWFGSFDKIEQQSIMDVYLDHGLDYRSQRRTRTFIDSVRWSCLPIYPYMDERLNRVYRSLPLAHLNAERAHRALLVDYKTGLESLPYAGRSFAGVPIYQEYRYRHIIHLGRILRQKVMIPLQQKWQETKGTCGFGQNTLSRLCVYPLDAELQKLDQCQLFNRYEVQNLIERAKRGAFVNTNAIERLINAVVIDDFLFGPGLSGDRALKFLKTPQEIHFVPLTA